MANNEFINGIGGEFDRGNTDPFINPREAREAIREDFSEWERAIEAGLADAESSALMAALGVENPYDVSGVSLSNDNDQWTISITEGGDIHQADVGEALPFWVWDWFYTMADEFGWDWEVLYE